MTVCLLFLLPACPAPFFSHPFLRCVYVLQEACGNLQAIFHALRRIASLSKILQNRLALLYRLACMDTLSLQAPLALMRGTGESGAIRWRHWRK